MQWSEVNGAVMRHHKQGSGPTLVLVHEMGGTMHSYDAVSALLEPDFTVVRYDLRGAGLSEKVSGQLDPGLLASDLEALIDMTGAAPAIVVGAAVGAGIALLAAARSPARIRGVLGFSPVADCPPENRAAILGHAGRIETEGLRVLEPHSIPAILPVSLRHDERAFADARGRWLVNDPRSFAAIYRMFANLDLRPHLAHVTQPCLMVGARHDGLRTPEAVRKLAEALPQGRFLEIDSGHVAAAQTPDLVAGVIRNFAKELLA
jgi:pimeloyl-ACP methyl ester carboxylesterase